MEIKENNKISLNDFDYNDNYEENEPEENEIKKKLKSKIIKNLNSIFSSSSSENESENERENMHENSPKIFNEEEEENQNYFKLPWKQSELNPSLIKKNTEIKISPLPENCTEAILFKIFSQFGSIIHIELNNTNAFIRFSSINEAKKILSLKKISYLSKNIYIYPSNDNIEIFLANLDKKWNYKKLFNELKKFIKFKNIRMLNNNNENNNNNRGYCFIEFNNAIEARKSFKILKEKKIILNKFLTIDWAKGLNKENDINKFQLFIKGITEDINITKLYEIFSNFGKINFIKLARDSINIKNNNNNENDYGFITFDNEKDCENALKNFNSKDYFKNHLITVEYAKKLSSIREHRERVSKNLLEKKRKFK